MPLCHCLTPMEIKKIANFMECVYREQNPFVYEVYVVFLIAMSWTKVQAGHPMWPAKRVKALVFGQPILAALKGMALALSVAYIEGPLLIISAILASGVVLPYLFWASLSERSSFAAGSFALFQLAFIGAVVVRYMSFPLSVPLNLPSIQTRHFHVNFP